MYQFVLTRLSLALFLGGLFVGCSPVTNSQVYENSYPKKVDTPFRCEVCFTPGENCLHLILKALEKAQISIHVMAYALTSQPITDALIAAKSRGVSVIVIADKTQLRGRYSKLDQLSKAGITIYIDNQPRIQHNKIMIIDETIVIGGSYNWSDSAEKRNAENLTISHSTNLAARYQTNFEKRRAASYLFDGVDKKNHLLYPINLKMIDSGVESYHSHDHA